MTSDNRRFSALLRRATRVSSQHSIIQGEITDAFIERYGVTHSDLDCDTLIDRLDYGCGPVSLNEVDAEMARCGHPKLDEGQSDDN